MDISGSSLSLNIPKIWDFKLLGKTDPMWGGSLTFTFRPPSSTEDWPDTIGEIGDRSLRSMLAPHLLGPNAIGSKFPQTMEVDIQLRLTVKFTQPISLSGFRWSKAMVVIK